MSKNTVGKVHQVMGAVVDVHFEGELPEAERTESRPTLVLEVALGENATCGTVWDVVDTGGMIEFGRSGNWSGL